MSTAKTSEKAAAGGAETIAEAKGKRSIQMKWFFTDADKARVALAKAENKPPEECQKIGGQIIGTIFEVQVRTNELPDGSTSESLAAIGEFEAINFESGEVIEAPTAYLPKYYLETVKAALERDASIKSILVGANVVAVATGKAIPVAYELVNLVPREPDSPMNRLKAAIAKTGKLRLAPPQEIKALDAPAEPAA
jgi:hypothetical protein